MDEYSVEIDKEDCGPSPAHYNFNGRVMLISLVTLFLSLLIIAFFHMYTRWLFLRRSRLRIHNHRIRRAHDEPALNAGVITASSAPQGLGATVLKSLPTFVYSSRTHSIGSPLLECAVCLSEFEDHETGRILPKCNHCFHVDCIDMWFQSHSNCPLCRSPVQNPDGTVVLVVQLEQPPETDTISGLLFPCPTNYQTVEDQMGCSNSLVQIVLSSLVEDSKLPEFTTISVEAPEKSGDQGTSSPMSSGSNGHPECK